MLNTSLIPYNTVKVKNSIPNPIPTFLSLLFKNQNIINTTAMDNKIIINISSTSARTNKITTNNPKSKILSEIPSR